MEDTIKILGARVHNLKNVDLEIPRRKLVVVTGLSGSGKSSLAFDTIYAEGQRRYMETLSTYARQFVGTMERPDVDKITGLSPVVAIEQKTTNKNPRSTVGTVTEINDFLRLLYARASRAYSPVTGEEMVHYTDDQIAELILTGFAGRKIALMAPIVKGRKGHYRELFESLAKKGYIYARIDGEIREISSGMRLDRYKIHTIDLVVDRLVVSEESRERLMTSLKESMRQGKGTMAVHDYGTGQQRFYSRHLMCPSRPPRRTPSRSTRPRAPAPIATDWARRRFSTWGRLFPMPASRCAKGPSDRWASTATTCFSPFWRCWAAVTISRSTILSKVSPRRR